MTVLDASFELNNLHTQMHFYRSDCFAVNGILPLEAILLSPFMCVYMTIIATILQVMWIVHLP